MCNRTEGRPEASELGLPDVSTHWNRRLHAQEEGCESEESLGDDSGSEEGTGPGDTPTRGRTRHSAASLAAAAAARSAASQQLPFWQQPPHARLRAVLNLCRDALSCWQLRSVPHE